MVFQNVSCAVTLVHVEIDDQDVLGGTFGEQHQRSDGDVVEGAEPRALRAPRMMAAAGGVAGNAVDKRQPCRQNRAAGGELCPQRNTWPHRKADLALDLFRHRTSDDLIDIISRMGKLQPGGRRRLGHRQRLGLDQTPDVQGLHQQRIFAHRKAMIDGEASVVIGVVDDLQGHALDPTNSPDRDFGWPSRQR